MKTLLHCLCRYNAEVIDNLLKIIRKPIHPHTDLKERLFTQLRNLSVHTMQFFLRRSSNQGRSKTWDCFTARRLASLLTTKANSLNQTRKTKKV